MRHTTPITKPAPATAKGASYDITDLLTDLSNLVSDIKNLFLLF